MNPALVNINSIAKTYDFGIVLTGGIFNESQTEGLYLGSNGDRIWQTLRLYRNKKIKKIIISGGNLFSETDKDSENEKCKDFLIDNAVPAADIIQEKKSRNTYENAKFTATILKKIQPNSTQIIITSAFHLKRAKACFTKQGLKVSIFPAFIIGQNSTLNWLVFIPHADYFLISDKLFNEVMGLLMYKILGYA